MYAMMHVAIHDALNGIDRRSRPYAVDLRTRRRTSPDAAVAAAAHDVLVPVLGSFSFFLPADCIDAGVAQRGSRLRGRARRDPGRQGEDAGHRPGAGRRRRDPRACGPPTATTRLPIDPNYVEGTAPGEYRYTPGTPFAFAPHLGEDLTPFALRDGSPVPSGPAVPADKPSVRRRTSRRCSVWEATTSSRRVHRTDDQTRDRAVLGRELTAAVEPDRQDRLDRRGARPLGERQTVRLAEHRLDGWLHRHVRDEVPLPLLATGHRHPSRGHRRQPGDDRRPDVDAAGAERHRSRTTTQGTPIEGGAAAQVLRRFFHTDRMSFSLCSFTLPEGERCSDASPTLRHFTRFSQAMRRERGVSDLRGLPLPGCGWNRDPPRQEDR